ncbi:MAG TPA: GNAT family N-acetyltransferase [Acetobacteraceae bacterium]|nr:GNAT family N-acetyltransferase [Acetobacteraceae bacterium]
MEPDNHRTTDQPLPETERLTLRRPVTADIGAIVAIAGDWEIARRLGRVPHRYGEKDARFFLECVVPNELAWAITLRRGGELVGMVGLNQEPNQDAPELGYYVDRGHWGLGIATEAARAVVEHGIYRLGLRRITAGYFADNPASGRVLRKLGFVQTGQGERPCLATGLRTPSVEMLLKA